MIIQFFRRLFVLPIRGVSKLHDAALSRRGMLLGFLAAAAIFSMGTWLRPMLSQDLRATHLPLGIGADNELSVVDLLTAPRSFRWDSVGAILLVVIGVAALVTLIRVRWAGFFLGVLLATSMMSLAATVLNHPELIAAMDAEEEQRVHISSILHQESDLALSGTSPPRTTTVRWRQREVMRKAQELEPGDLLRGWLYSVYGPWLVFTTMFALLGTTRGSWERRLGILGIWTVVGVALAGGVCSRRLMAEYYWTQAQTLEQAGDLNGARGSIERCVALLPEMERLQDTALLIGKMDHRQKRDSTPEVMFRAHQFTEHGDFSQALALAQGLVRGKQVEEMPLPARTLAASIFCEGAMQNLSANILAAARDKYDWAGRLAPQRVDCPIGLSAIACHSDQYDSEQVSLVLEPLLTRVGDRLLRADLHERLGYAYFQAGQFDRSRHHYQASLDEFCLPKATNLPAQEGMVGM